MSGKSKNYVPVEKIMDAIDLLDKMFAERTRLHDTDALAEHFSEELGVPVTVSNMRNIVDTARKRGRAYTCADFTENQKGYGLPKAAAVDNGQVEKLEKRVSELETHVLQILTKLDTMT